MSHVTHVEEQKTEKSQLPSDELTSGTELLCDLYLAVCTLLQLVFGAFVGMMDRWGLGYAC